VTRISDITGSSMVWRRTIQSKPWWNNGARRIDVVLNVESTGFRDFAFSFPLFVWWGFWDFKPTSRASPEEGKRGYFLRSSAASSACPVPRQGEAISKSQASIHQISPALVQHQQQQTSLFDLRYQHIHAHDGAITALRIPTALSSVPVS
jgi:hypothetical protein